MPRPPVKPEDRQRVAWACNACKASKKRCDGKQPCNACRKRGQVDSCRYAAGRRNHLPRPGTSSDASSSTRPSVHPVVSPPATWGSRHVSPEPALAGLAHHRVAAIRENSSENIAGDASDTQASSTDSFGQPAVMVSSLSGEKVFVGDTAAISFFRFLQRTLKRHVGPSGFTDDQDSHRLFEVTASDTSTERFRDDLGIEEKKAFIQCFLDASSGLLDLFTWREITQLLELSQEVNRASSGTSTPKNVEDAGLASLYLIIAIGAQCRGSNPEDLSLAAKFFVQARKMSFDKMLQDPTLNLTRAFLLMAFYMCGACRRNSAFMYIGVASKAADILGLHVSGQNKNLPSEVRDARLRTARSLRAFDVVCSSILGRRSSAMPVRSAASSSPSNLDAHVTPGTYRALALTATYELTTVLDAAVAKSSEDGLDATSAEVFLRSLRERSRALPGALRQQPEKGDGSREVTIGNVHVAGTYYFGVILVTRQFLIHHIMPQLRGRQRLPSRIRPFREAPTNDVVAELSRACIEAATYMAQMCRQVMEAGALLGNMCIMKAWIFATGLVLGFSLLVEDNDNSEGRQAFLSSLRVLGELKRLSPQAGQYYGILTNFSEAIESYKQQLQREEQTARESLVDRIFSPTFHDDREPLNAHELPTQLPTPNMTVLEDSPVTWLGDNSMPAFGAPLNEQQWWMSGENDVIMRLLWDGYATDWSNPLSASDGLDIPFET